MKALLLALPLLMSGNTPDFESYCQSGDNSWGIGAVIVGEGTSSLALDDCSMNVTNMVGNRYCGIMYGTVPMELPFGDGWLCLHPGYSQFIGGTKYTSATGEQNWQATLDFASPGDTIYFQAWYRDPGFGSQFNTSNGLKVNVRL
jgi:hypothetical protein